MTDDEKRRQKADLLLEYLETEQHLGHLQEKARQISYRLAAVSEWLAHAADKGSGTPETFWSEKMHTEVDIAQDAQVRDAMNFPAALVLVTEIRGVQNKLSHLKERKASLGLR